jgi:protein arginine kinase activator
MGMNCEECKQHPATVHLTKIFNNQKTELHLCEECARHHDDIPFKLGFTIEQTEQNFSIQKFLVGLLGVLAPGAEQDAEETAASAIQCPNCGLTYGQFGQVGRFGCSHCYESFAGQLEPLLRRVQGNSRHTGKVPLRAGETVGYRREIVKLRQELHKSIASEAYERAAELRDQIHALEDRVKSERLPVPHVEV